MLDNKVIHADSMKIMSEMPDNFVHMTLTDIPYNVVNRKSNGLRKLNKENADVRNFDLGVFIDNLVRITQGSLYIFCATEDVSFIRGKLIKANLTTRLCIFEKTNPSPLNGQYMWLSAIETCVYGRKKGAIFNEHCKSPVWRYSVVRNQKHPTQKNLELFKYLIKTSSNPGDTIFDPCAGVFTTAIASDCTNRNWICIDITEKYTQIGLELINDNRKIIGLSPVETLKEIDIMYDLIGKRFGKLVVLERIGNEGIHIKWKCLCDCGNYHNVCGLYLRRGKCKSCGCIGAYNKEHDREKALFYRLYKNTIVKGAKSRGHETDVNFEEFVVISKSTCYYCGLENSNCLKDVTSINRKKITKKYIISDKVIYFNGIDRLDSKVGYYKHNIVPCCKHCNIAKNILSVEDYMKFIKRVYEYNNKS